MTDIDALVKSAKAQVAELRLKKLQSDRETREALQEAERKASALKASLRESLSTKVRPMAQQIQALFGEAVPVKLGFYESSVHITFQLYTAFEYGVSICCGDTEFT